MKLLFLPPKPLLTKRGTPRKRRPFRSPGRVFLANGEEIKGLATLSIRGGDPVFIKAGSGSGTIPAKYEAATLTLEFVSPEVVLIDKAPEVAA